MIQRLGLPFSPGKRPWISSMNSVGVLPNSVAWNSGAAMSVKRMFFFRSSHRSSLISRTHSGHSPSKKTSTVWSVPDQDEFGSGAIVSMGYFNRIRTSLRRSGPGVKGGS